MPIYEYECRSCGKRTEVLQRMDEAPLAACPQCGGEVRKLLSAPAVQFKGSGWYVTDYAGKKGGGGGTSSASETKTEKTEKTEKKDTPAESKSSGSSSSGTGSSGGAE